MSADARQITNEFRHKMFGGDAERTIAFVCECGDPDCQRSVLLTPEEYAERRPGPIFHSGHDEEAGGD